ncbi:Flp family type IVb pilin [Caulobacter sp.]|uniref:Flp family type IVb pilin n=1 Tax=Caulobacter sp. TaxID=78 RepID=UPI0025BD5716|nr:Flp family type IVb pilin [Caulobacter sp.]
MGEARQAHGLSDAARGRAAGRLAARSALSRFWHDDSGATAVEVGLLVGLITVVIAAAVTASGAAIKGAFNKASDGFGN